MNLRLLSGPELWIVFGVLFLMGLAWYVVVVVPDESDFGPAGAERERRRRLDAATETPLEPIRRHGLIVKEKR